MFCKYCGSEVPDKSEFCFRCGRNINSIQTVDKKPIQTEKKIEKSKLSKVNQSTTEKKDVPKAAEKTKNEADTQPKAKNQKDAKKDNGTKGIKFISLIVYPIADFIMYGIVGIIGAIFGVEYREESNYVLVNNRTGVVSRIHGDVSVGPTAITFVIGAIIGSFLVYRIFFHEDGQRSYNRTMSFFAVLGTVISFIIFFMFL